MRAVGARRRQVALVYVRTACCSERWERSSESCSGSCSRTCSPVLRLDLLGDRRRLRRRRDGARGQRARRSARARARRAAGDPAGGPGRPARGARGDRLGGRGQDAGDAILRRVRGSCRGRVQIGLRNVGRRRRRSIATAVDGRTRRRQPARSARVSLRASRTRRMSSGATTARTCSSWSGATLRAEQPIRSTPGVAAVEPMFDAQIRVAGEDGFVWAVRQATMFRYRIADGRWYTPNEERTRARVAVVERNLARVTGTRVGDRVRVETGSRPPTCACRHRREPAGERNGVLRPARDDAGRVRKLACRRRRLLDPHDLAGRRVRRPHDHAARGHA